MLSDKGLSPRHDSKQSTDYKELTYIANQQTDKAFLDCYDIHHGLKINKFRMIPQEIGQRILNKIISYPPSISSTFLPKFKFACIKNNSPNFKGQL